MNDSAGSDMAGQGPSGDILWHRRRRPSSAGGMTKSEKGGKVTSTDFKSVDFL